MAHRKIVEYQPSLNERLAELHGKAFQTGAAESAAYLEWKYQRNPYIDEPLIVVALNDKGDVVGMRGFYGTCWTIADKRIVIPCADDYAISEAEQNTGLATEIMRAATAALARRGFDLMLNLSGGVVTVLQSLAMGWKRVRVMEPVARTSRREGWRCALNQAMSGKRFLWRFSRDLRQNDLASFSRIDRLGPELRTGSAGVETGADVLAEQMSTVAAVPEGDGRVRHVRDPLFFRWKFANPTREYRHLYSWNGTHLRGFMIVAGYRQHPFRSPGYMIVDTEAEDDEVFGQLVDAAIELGRFPSLGAWSESLTGPRQGILETRGFRPSELARRARGLPCALLKNLQPGSEEVALLERATWDVRLADSMHG